jgi:hypothetical protein
MVIACLPFADFLVHADFLGSCMEWYYTGLKSTSEPNHNMYSVKRLYRSDGSPAGSVIPLTSICQSCMLFPLFSNLDLVGWKTDDVLDKSSSFLINNWCSTYSYKTIW